MVAALVCFGISLFFQWMARSTMDASDSYYSRQYRRCRIFFWTGTGLLVLGIAAYIGKAVFLK